MRAIVEARARQVHFSASGATRFVIQFDKQSPNPDHRGDRRSSRSVGRRALRPKIQV